ncbi:hypothetical protein ACVWZA_000919 [Sphingomonas sp. UYAg733]
MPEWTVPPLDLHRLTPPSSLRVQVLIDHLGKVLATPSWTDPG